MRFSLSEARELLKSGKAVGYPTETFWALGCDPTLPSAVESIFRIKERPGNKGIPLIISSTSWLEQFDIEEKVEVLVLRKLLLDAFWPGSLTIVVNPGDTARSFLAPGVVSDDGSIALRLSPHAMAQAMAQAAGGAITSTSLNRSGEASISTIERAEQKFPEVPVLEAQSSDYSGSFLPSTIVDLRKLPFAILRDGAIGRSEIERVISPYSTLAEA